VSSPVIITTKEVRDVFEEESRPDDVVARWDNYGNVTGESELDDNRLATVLGT
jgi:hypothetical protein